MGSSSLFQTHLDDYAKLFESHFAFTRRNGILEIRMHTDGGPLRWGGTVHRLLIPLFQFVDHDDETEVVILTGTGDSFNAVPDLEAYQADGLTGRWDSEAVGYDLCYRDQVREPLSLLNLSVPVIAAVNGPVTTHAELALLNDIVICTPETVFADAHWHSIGIVPGDGVHTLFRELLGPNRARYFLYMGQRIVAAEALNLGLVGEVIAANDLLGRAWEIAETVFMSRARVQRRLARSLLVQPWRELFVKELTLGMAHECLATAIGDPSVFAQSVARRLGRS